MLKYSGLKIDPFGYLWVCPRIKHMDIANVIQRVLENKQSLLELHSADGASLYFTYIYYVLNNTNRTYETFVRSLFPLTLN